MRRAIVALSMVAAGAACVSTDNDWTLGLPRDQIAIVQGTFDHNWLEADTWVRIAIVDGQEALRYAAQVELLPGRHALGVDYLVRSPDWSSDRELVHGWMPAWIDVEAGKTYRVNLGRQGGSFVLNVTEMHP